MDNPRQKAIEFLVGVIDDSHENRSDINLGMKIDAAKTILETATITRTETERRCKCGAEYFWSDLCRDCIAKQGGMVIPGEGQSHPNAPITESAFLDRYPIPKKTQAWRDRVIEKLNSIKYLGIDAWEWSESTGTFYIGGLHVSVDNAGNAVGEEIPKPKMETTYSRFDEQLKLAVEQIRQRCNEEAGIYWARKERETDVLFSAVKEMRTSIKEIRDIAAKDAAKPAHGNGEEQTINEAANKLAKNLAQLPISDLDALSIETARMIFGCTPVISEDGRKARCGCTGCLHNHPHCDFLQSYSTDIVAAYKVIDKFRQEHKDLSVAINDYGASASCTFCRATQIDMIADVGAPFFPPDYGRGRGKTIAEAICRAALDAVKGLAVQSALLQYVP